MFTKGYATNIFNNLLTYSKNILALDSLVGCLEGSIYQRGKLVKFWIFIALVMVQGYVDFEIMELWWFGVSYMSNCISSRKSTVTVIAKITKRPYFLNTL